MGLARRTPKGPLRWFLRAPIALYRMRLGWLLTSHFLMLTTTGRKSGRPRYAVVEIVKHDKTTGTYLIASGWGEKSDWYRNIQKTPQVHVDVGFRRFQALATFLSAAQKEEALYEYARRFPLPFRQIAKTISGETMTGTRAECTRLAQSAPLIALYPA